MSAEPNLERSDVLRRADGAWDLWRDFLAREESSGRAGVTGADGWTLGEAVAHVANWQVTTTDRIRRILAHEHLDKVDIEGQNAEWAAKDRGIAYDAAVGRLEAGWRELRKLGEEIPENRWKRFAPSISAVTWEHYEEHMAWRPGTESSA